MDPDRDDNEGLAVSEKIGKHGLGIVETRMMVRPVGCIYAPDIIIGAKRLLERRTENQAPRTLVLTTKGTTITKEKKKGVWLGLFICQGTPPCAGFDLWQKI